MYRMIMLYCAAEEGRKQKGLRGAVKTEVAIPAQAARRPAVHAGMRILVEDRQLPGASRSAWIAGVWLSARRLRRHGG